MALSLEAQLNALLQSRGVEPVLVDVGASGGAPEIWRPIAGSSTYVGFDPDLREIRRDTTGGFRSGIVINKALCADPAASSVTFHLTESPYCSSMLEPDAQALADYSFWRLFQVQRTASVAASTLDAVLAEQGLAHLDWLKIDAQGADLRIYRSLGARLRDRMIAVDTEPGLIDAYQGEDLFTDVHRQLTAEGFWLSRLNVMGVPRLSKGVMAALRIETAHGMPQGIALRTSPGWCEARYLRSARWLAQHGAGEREVLLSWVFAVLDSQYGHALEVAQLARQNGMKAADELWRSAQTLLRAPPAPDRASLPVRALRKLRRAARKLMAG